LGEQLRETARLLPRPQSTTAHVVTLPTRMTFDIWLNMVCMKIKAEYFDKASAMQSIIQLA
jgi:hypothetical protein